MVDPFGFNKKVLFTSDTHLQKLQFNEVLGNFGIQSDDACIVFNASDEEGSLYLSRDIYDNLSQDGHLGLLITEENIENTGCFTIYRSVDGDFSLYPEITIFPEKFLQKYGNAHHFDFSEMESLAKEDITVKDAIVKNGISSECVYSQAADLFVNAVKDKDIETLKQLSALALCSKNAESTIRQYACIWLGDNKDYSNLLNTFTQAVLDASDVALEMADKTEIRKINSLVESVLEMSDNNQVNKRASFMNLLKSPATQNKQLKKLTHKTPVK